MENLVRTLVKQSYDAALAARRNRARIDSEPHNSFGFLSAVGVVNGHDELTKRQAPLPAICFHGLKFKPEETA
jgi:hypothetical protein